MRASAQSEVPGSPALSWQRLRRASTTSTDGSESVAPSWPRQLATTDAHAARASSSGSAKAVGTPFPAWTRETNSWEMLEAASPSAPPRAATRAGTSCACGSHDVDMSRAMNCVIWPGSAAAGSPTHSVVTVCSTASDPMCSSSRGISFGSAKPAATAAAAVAAAAAAAAASSPSSPASLAAAAAASSGAAAAAHAAAKYA